MRNYIFEANKLGVKILPPSVNTSTEVFNPEGNDLRYPLLGIKNLGVNTVKSILTERANGRFDSYIDFVNRTHSFLSKRVLESLINASALDEFKLTKRTMIERLDEVINFTEYGNYIAKEEFVLNSLGEYKYSILEENEKLVLGFNLVMNPLIEHSEYIKKHNLYKPSTLSKSDIGKEVRLVGILASIRKIKTKKGANMAFVTVQDEYSKLDGVLFTFTFNKYIDLLEKNCVYLFKVVIEERNNDLQLVIQRVHKL